MKAAMTWVTAALTGPRCGHGVRGRCAQCELEQELAGNPVIEFAEQVLGHKLVPWQKLLILAALEKRRCRVCGCSDHAACLDLTAGACHWVEPDLCSACSPRPEGAGL